ncbi:MAG: NUDIX domain-containing protein [Patescibacteria group bacterium]
MNNKIIVEGLWNTGKSTVAECLKKSFGYAVVSEPDHLKAKEPIIDIDGWYIDQHGKNHDLLYGMSDRTGAVMERSIISSMAFLYASNKKVEMTLSVFERFRDWYAKNESLVVVLYPGTGGAMPVLSGVEDESVRAFLGNSEFTEKYDYFYRVVLPFEYNIAPLFIDIFDTSGARKTANDIVRNIAGAVEKDRIAQVNVVCFKEAEGKPKFLVMKRNEKKGGFWQTITGGVHAKELLNENALRETAEEVGIRTDKTNLLTTQYAFHYIGGEGYELNEYVYGYKLEDSDTITLSDEHVEAAFLDEDEAIGRVKYDGNKAAVREVARVQHLQNG